jgi:hypothetical protein
VRRVGIVLMMAGLALAATPAGAFAQEEEEEEASVLIVGVPQVGQRLDAVLAVGEDAEGWDEVSYVWRRCTSESRQDCEDTEAPSAASYTIVAADLDHRIRVRAVPEDGEDVLSDPTAVVTNPPVPDPGPLVAPPPEAAADPVTTPPRMMDPAPKVRISGRLTRSGALIERLSVRAPRGVTIRVRCRGDGCPRRKLARSTAVTRLRAFERHLRAGIRLEIRVTRSGFIGKHTVIRIRRGKVPWRRDRCLFPGSNVPARCPGS